LKRYGAIILAILFVLGLAATAFAIHAEIPAESQAVIGKGSTQITLGGSLRFRGDLNENDFRDNTSPNAYYDSRIRISLDAKVSDRVQGFVMVEAGNGQKEDNWTWGSSRAAKGLYQVGDAKRGEFNILQAWINYKATDSIGLKVGHMPLALGNKIFFNHTKFGDDAIVVYGSTSNIHWALLTAKFSEGEGTKKKKLSDDSTAYVGLVNYKGDMFNIDANLTYVDDQSNSTHPAINEIHGWNFGLDGSVNVAGFDVRGDVELNFGKLCIDADSKADCLGLGQGELDAKGYAVMLGVDYKMGSTKLTLEGGIGSGDDDATDGDAEVFINSLGGTMNAPLYTFVYDYSVPGAAGITDGGIANTTYLKLAASTKATKDLSVKGQIVWLKATEDVVIGKSKTGKDVKEDDLGWEIDGKVSYKLAKNLEYYVEAGYLFAGDAYDTVEAGKRTDADDAWRIRHGIQLKF